MSTSLSSLHDFHNTRVLVIGDIMIDQYWFGEVKRISPEAPVPVVDLSRVENRLGGAANVALNLKAMGAITDIIGIAGQDTYGQEVVLLLQKENIESALVWASPERRTTVKSRIMAQGQNLLRVDQEDSRDLSDTEWEAVRQIFDSYCTENKPDVIILQDYNKGLLTSASIAYFIAYANEHGIPTMVDPKKHNFFDYKNCTVFKPNKKEVFDALGTPKEASLTDINGKLLEKLNAQYNFITLSADGIFVGSEQEHTIYPTKRRFIVDVCGAGDTVLSIISLYWTKHLPAGIIARLANIAGGQVCGVAGVAPIQKEAFLEEVAQQGILKESVDTVQ